MCAGATPDGSANDTAWGCLADAVMVVRSSGSFEDAIALAAKLEGHRRDVGVVVGMLAGMRYGASAIPQAWLDGTAGDVLGTRYDVRALIDLHRRMLSAD